MKQSPNLVLFYRNGRSEKVNSEKQYWLLCFACFKVDHLFIEKYAGFVYHVIFYNSIIFKALATCEAKV